jgi:hypothetical protein
VVDGVVSCEPNICIERPFFTSLVLKRSPPANPMSPSMLLGRLQTYVYFVDGSLFMVTAKGNAPVARRAGSLWAGAETMRNDLRQELIRDWDFAVALLLSTALVNRDGHGADGSLAECRHCTLILVAAALTSLRSYWTLDSGF